MFISVTEEKNSQTTQKTPVAKLYGASFINTTRARGSKSVVFIDGKFVEEERIVSESYTTISGLLSIERKDYTIPLTIKGVSGNTRDTYPYGMSIKASQIVEVYANPNDNTDSIVRVRTNENKDDLYYTVDETLTDVLGKTPRVYKALLSQNAPIASQTSGTFIVGQIWTIQNYKEGVVSNFDAIERGTGYTTSTDVATTGGSGDEQLTVDIVADAGVITSISINNPGSNYIVGDILTITTGNADATIEILAVESDDFSNMELISGTMNTNGAVIRATSTTPTDWSYGSDLSYDGAPYIVSTDADGDFNPLINTTGVEPLFSYNGSGDNIATFTGLFANKSKVYHNAQNTTVGGQVNILIITDDDMGIATLDNTGTPADDILNYTPFEIEINP